MNAKLHPLQLPILLILLEKRPVARMFQNGIKIIYIDYRIRSQRK